MVGLCFFYSCVSSCFHFQSTVHEQSDHALVPPAGAAPGGGEVHPRHRCVELRVRAAFVQSQLVFVRRSFSCWRFCHRCILGELFTKKPIFQANQELAQLELIR